MPWHINFRNDLDVARPGVAEQVPDLVVGVGVVDIPVLDPLGGIIQNRIFSALDAPCGIVRQVPVESIQLQPRHFVNIRLERFNRPEIAACVVHEAADGERRAVLDVAARVISLSSQLIQRSAGIENTRIRGCPDQDASGADLELIAFSSQRLGQGSVLVNGNGCFFGACPCFPVHLGRKGNERNRRVFFLLEGVR